MSPLAIERAKEIIIRRKKEEKKQIEETKGNGDKKIEDLEEKINQLQEKLDRVLNAFHI